MSTRKLVLWILFLAIFAMAARISVDTDTWWHLRAGQWIVEQRSVPQQDPFSHTRLGAAWQYPGWLVEVPMIWIYQAFGPGGLNLWTAAMVTLTFGFVWLTLRGGVFLRAFVIILAAATSGVYWAARPYLMTFLLAAVFLAILENDRKTKDAHSHDGWRDGIGNLWLLPLLMCIWANSHGGFAVGFILWGVYFTARVGTWISKRFLLPEGEQPGAARPDNMFILAGVGMLMVVGVCLNPSGPVMLLYPFKTVGIDVLQKFIQEWQSPNFHETQVQPFLWLLLGTMGALGISRRRILVEDFLLVVGFAYLSFMAGRNIALFALVAPMVLTRHLEPVLQEARARLGISGSRLNSGFVPRGQSILNWTILGILVLAVGLKASLVTPLEINQMHFEETLPIAAVDYLKESNPQGPLFNSYNWGSYLLWALPEYPVFVDGRTDLYGDELIGEWVRVVQAEDGWQDVLNKWEIKVIMLEDCFNPKLVLTIGTWIRYWENCRKKEK